MNRKSTMAVALASAALAAMPQAAEATSKLEGRFILPKGRIIFEPPQKFMQRRKRREQMDERRKVYHEMASRAHYARQTVKGAHASPNVAKDHPDRTFPAFMLDKRRAARAAGELPFVNFREQREIGRTSFGKRVKRAVGL